MLIIDNMPYKYYVMSNLIYYMTRYIIATAETSTYSKIKRHISNKHNGLSDLINELFDIVPLESSSNKNAKIVAFKKKNIKPQEMIKQYSINKTFWR